MQVSLRAHRARSGSGGEPLPCCLKPCLEEKGRNSRGHHYNQTTELGVTHTIPTCCIVGKSKAIRYTQVTCKS